MGQCENKKNRYQQAHTILPSQSLVVSTESYCAVFTTGSGGQNDTHPLALCAQQNVITYFTKICDDNFIYILRRLEPSVTGDSTTDLSSTFSE